MNDSINGRTKVLGLIGNPVGHSFSPQLHNRLSAELGLNMTYVPFKVEEQNLEDAVKGLRALNVIGFNVTVPHKQAVLKLIDVLSAEAEQMGAVNTVKNIDGKLHGYNTDSYGFVRSFHERFHKDLKDRNVTILGAGGASRAIAAKIASLGVKNLYILNRTGEQAEKLAEFLKSIPEAGKAGTRVEIAAGDLSLNCIRQASTDCDIIINTTSAGMYPDIEASPVTDITVFKNKPIVCDIIANPSKTRFLKMAEQNGCRIMNGVGMLYYQGIRAYEIWTGINIPEDIVAKVGNEFFNNYNEAAECPTLR